MPSCKSAELRSSFDAFKQIHDLLEENDELHEKLEELTEIPVDLQKIMYKGGLKDKTKTLTEAGIKENVKMMLMGSKPTAVKALTDAGTPRGQIPAKCI